MIKKTLYFSNKAHLSVHYNQLIIKSIDEKDDTVKERSIPIEDIGIIIIESLHVTLTTNLISNLLNNNVALVTCDRLHMPQGLLLNLSGNTLQSERFSAQISASLPLKKQLWQQTIQAKIANQAECLSRCTGAETGCMMQWTKSVKSGDSDNLEGRAAAYYWKNMFPQDFHFTRDPAGNPPNNLLNYGYTILRSIIARALVGSGLLPTLGIHHSNRYNAYCLADDIMEPYRPFVDMLVIEIIDKHGVDLPLDKEHKTELLSLPVMDVTIDGKKSPLMVAASLTTASLAKCFLGLQRKILYPSMS